MKKQLTQIGRKVRRQIGKDYIFFPALTGPAFVHTAAANATANLTRNLWSYMIIFCGHFPDGALHFTEEEVEDETRAEWYLRQMLGSANFTGGPLLHIMSGNLGYQIEHHLFPDLPSNRYAEISDRVRPLCDKYGIPYTTGPLLQAVRPGAADDHEAVAAQQVHQARTVTTTRRPRRSRAAAGGRRAARPVVPRPVAGPRRRPRDRPLRAGMRRDIPFASMGDLGLDKRKVTQCALSRICGVCGESLGRPVAFLGTPEEAGRNEFHFPPAHVACAEAALGACGAACVERRARPPGRAGRRGCWSPPRASSSSGPPPSGRTGGRCSRPTR